MLRLTFALLALFAALTGNAADFRVVQETAEQHVRIQTKGNKGKVTIRMGQIDIAKLPNCDVHEAFTPPGSRMIGNTSIGVRCLAPHSWSVLVPVQIAITGNYITTARALPPGQLILASDLVVLNGDLSSLPAGILSDPSEAVGKSLKNALGAGQPLRAEQLMSPLVIRQNQSVRVVSKGDGFAASAEGRALNNAAEGQVVQVRMSSGQTVSGIAKNDGSVEISF